MIFTTEEDERVDQLLAKIRSRLTCIDLELFEDELPYKKRKGLQVEREALTGVEGEIVRIWRLEYKLKSVSTAESNVTGLLFDSEIYRNRHGDINLKLRAKWSFYLEPAQAVEFEKQ